MNKVLEKTVIAKTKLTLLENSHKYRIFRTGFNRFSAESSIDLDAGYLGSLITLVIAPNHGF